MKITNLLRNEPAFDVSRLEREVEEAMTMPTLYAPKPREDEDIGRLTSETVLASYESAAKSLEALAAELRSMLTAHDEMVREADDGLKQIEEVIAVCRENGKRFALRVSVSADMVRNIREQCAAMQQQIRSPE